MSKVLREWAINYFTYKKACMAISFDIIKTPRLKLKHKEYEEEIVCAQQLKPLPKKQRAIIITLDTKPNLDFLIQHWKQFCIPHLKIYFVNPKASNQKWIVTPYVHDHISSNIKKSLASIASASRKK